VQSNGAPAWRASAHQSSMGPIPTQGMAGPGVRGTRRG
jgi:hypothetical protein